MKEFCEEWLEYEWAQKLDSKLCVMCQKNHPFREWYNDFYSQALLLNGTLEEMTEKDLRQLVYSLMDDHLHSCVDLDCIHSLKTLKEWTNALISKDHAIRLDIVHMCKCVNDGQLVSNGNHSARSLAVNNNNNIGSGTSDAGCTRPPPLMQDEKALLDKHDSCYRCCKFYVGCRSNKCTAPYPNRTNYVALTVVHAQSDATL